MKSEMTNRAPLNSTFREESSGRRRLKNAQLLSPRKEALDGSREKTMRIANVENNVLNWVSILSAGALDMTHCDFSAKSVTG